MFQSAFCAIGIIGVIASFGFFDMVWRWDFYIQFTNISNYMCVGIMIIYPYFFLNIDTYGVGGVCLWILGLGAVFIGVGFIFMGLDKVLCKKK